MNWFKRHKFWTAALIGSCLVLAFTLPFGWGGYSLLPVGGLLIWVFIVWVVSRLFVKKTKEVENE